MQHNNKEIEANQDKYSIHSSLSVYIKKFPNHKVYKRSIDHQYSEIHFHNNIARNNV